MMKSRIEKFSGIGIGVIAGIALVVSCGDKMEHGAAQQDMSISGSGGGTCSGSCTVTGPIAVSSVQQPVTVSGNVGVSGSVAVSGIASPVSIAGPINVAGPLKVITADTARTTKTSAARAILKRAPSQRRLVRLPGGTVPLPR
jgi:hypothetical protein